MCTDREKEEDLKRIPVDEVTEAFMALESRHYHVYEMLRLLWGSYACDVYLNHLFLDTRNGTRTGFEPSMVEVITKLAVAHTTAYRDKVPTFRSVV